MTDQRPPRAIWRRLAQAGFWFFLIKGLVWLALAALAVAGGWQLTD